MTTQPHGKNDTRFDDLLGKARELGVAAGKGKDTLVQFGLLVVNAAYDGVLDLAKDKHGNGLDDAVRAYSEYGKAMATSTIFDHKSPSGKVQAAKIRSCIKLGGWTRGGPGEPISSVNKLMAQRDKLRRDPLTCKSLDDAYNTLLRFARYQVKQNHTVDDAQLLRAFCLKPVSQAKTLEDFLQETAKRLDDLRTGRAASNTLSHTSTQLTTAVMLIRQEVTDLRTGKNEAAVETDEDSGE